MRVLILASLIIGFVYGDDDDDFRTRNFTSRMPTFPKGKSSSKQFYNSEITPFIVGGEEVIPHSIPYQAFLVIDQRYACGGSLLNEHWVLTAAHCIFGASTVRVVLGAHNIRTSEPTQVIRFINKTEDIIPHYLYNPDTFDNDLGLLYFKQPVEINTKVIDAISLPTSDLYGEEDVTVSGWGVTSDAAGATISNVLKKAIVKTITNEKCNCFYNDFILPNMICTRGGSDGTCFGDSGGPLAYTAKRKTTLFAVTSFVANVGCTSRFPHGFQRVFPHLHWINRKIKQCSDLKY